MGNLTRRTFEDIAEAIRSSLSNNGDYVKTDALLANLRPVFKTNNYRYNHERFVAAVKGSN